MNPKKLVSSFGLALALALFSGCAGQNFDYSDARRIQPGMTTDQVVAVMKSKPNVTEVHGDETHFVWAYGNLAGQVKQVRVRFDKKRSRDRRARDAVIPPAYRDGSAATSHHRRKVAAMIFETLFHRLRRPFSRVRGDRSGGRMISR